MYDFPPSVSKDVTDAHPVREETYDVPPHFAKLKPHPPVTSGHYLHNNVSDDDDEPPIPEDVYDVPPPILTDKHYLRDRGAGSQPPQEIYDIPAALRAGDVPVQDVYDFPREREDRGERGDQYIYDVPPQVGQLGGPLPRWGETLFFIFVHRKRSCFSVERSAWQKSHV